MSSLYSKPQNTIEISKGIPWKKKNPKRGKVLPLQGHQTASVLLVLKGNKSSFHIS